MTTLELTRGNYVLYQDRKVEIISITKLTVRVFDIENNNYVNYWVPADELSGVPLTKEKLQEIMATVQERFVFSMPREGEWRVFFAGKHLTTIQYEHQLQNLFKVVDI